MKLGHVKRSPGLINLPLSLPSLPIVNPLVTALVGDSNQGTTSAAQVTTTPASPTTTPSSGGSGSGEGSGSSQGSGGSGSGQGSSGSGSSQGSGSGSSNQGSGSTTEGTGGSGSSGSGSGSGSGQSNDGTPPTDNTSSKNSTDSTTTQGGHSLVANAGNQPPSGLAGAITATDSTTAVGTNVVTTVFSSGIPIATHTSLSSGGNAGSGSGPQGTDGGDGGDGSGDNTSNNSGDTSGHGGLSGGAIAGIVIVAIILGLSLVIVYLRKRSKTQRTERRRRWWQGRTQADDAYRWSGNGTGDATLGSGGSGVMSTRSSFATTFDHASGEATMTLDFTDVAPPMPPMAELRDAHGPGLLLHSQDHGSPILVNVTDPDEQRRVSTYSNRSSSSDSHAQYLSYTDPFIGHSPISARSFSPSELFSFPKPPTNDIPKTSTAGSGSPTPDSPNPFADPTEEDGSQSIIETVRRPFTPTLHDEVGVSIGDRVRISKVFDDGWALIEKYPAGSGEKGKAKQIQGLIPIDCLREAGEDVPAFLASKRISSSGARGVAA